MIASIHLSYRGCAAKCKVNGDAYAATIYIPDGKLQRLFRADPKTTGAVLANYVRQAFGWPRGENNHTIIHFRPGN